MQRIESRLRLCTRCIDFAARFVALRPLADGAFGKLFEFAQPALRRFDFRGECRLFGIHRIDVFFQQRNDPAKRRCTVRQFLDIGACI